MGVTPEQEAAIDEAASVAAAAETEWDSDKVRPVRRYYLFVGCSLDSEECEEGNHSWERGWLSMCACSDNLDEIRYCASQLHDEIQWWHVVDIHTRRVIMSSAQKAMVKH